MKKRLVWIGLAVTVLTAAIGSAAMAQRTAASKALGDDYYFYRSEAYGHHADDNAYMLHQYASYGGTVPREIVEENAAGIRNNIESSRRAYSKLSAAARNHPEAAQHLSAIDKHYQNALARTKELDSEAAKKGDPHLIAGHAADIQKSLRAASNEHRQLLKKLNPPAAPTSN